MILRGTSIDLDQPREVSCAARSITQLMMFNSVKRERKEKKSGSTRHSSVRETPLPLYMGLLIHAKTRKRELVDILYEHGLSVSYDRVMQHSTDIANQVIAQYQEDGVVCPPKLKRGLFVTGQLDNVDHNPSSTSSQSSFHGTALSLICHVTPDAQGTDRSSTDENTPILHDKRVAELPHDYTHVSPVHLFNATPEPPSVMSANVKVANLQADAQEIG